MSLDEEALPYVDTQSTRVTAPRDVVWAALRRYVDSSLGAAESSPLTRLLGCVPRSGFEVSKAVPPRRLALSGRHRFARYRLVFELDETDDGGTLLSARTYSRFPGALGRGYRTLVIGTRGHVVVTRHMLRSIRRVADGRRE
jgi:hypothetical protein